MKIAATYSHLNGMEFLEARKPALLEEVISIIEGVDALICRTKRSREKTKQSAMVYAPRALNKAFDIAFSSAGWQSERTSYWVCEDARINRRIMSLPYSSQETEILRAGLKPIRSSNQTDFVKDRVAVEVQLGKYSFIAYDLFVKHLAFYVADEIDVGIEIIPMKSLQNHMSSGPGYFEAELYNLVRGGRGVPSVPLILFGIAV